MVRHRNIDETSALAGMTRRQLLERGAALGLATALPFGVARADTPQQGGTLRLGLGGGATTDSLDPRTYTQTVPRNIGQQICNQLVEITSQNKLIPELAESWEMKPGATEWVFNIRKNVQFHNGKTLDADDVIYSINLHRGEKSTSGARSLFTDVQDVKADGTSQVRITLSSGNVDLPYLFADYHMLIVPNGFTDFGKLIGTGGYALQSFTPGVGAKALRNKNYWKEGRAHVDAVETTVINDGTARFNSLQSDNIDVMNRLDRSLVAMLQGAAGIDVVRSAGGMHYTFAASTKQQPTSSNDVRLALKYAVDREQLIKVVFSGIGRPGNDHPIPDFDPFFNSDLPQRAHDPDKAKFYLKKAGLENLKLELYASDAAFPEAIDMATAYQAAAGKGGVMLDVKRSPSDGYWDNVWMKVPFCVDVWLSRPIDQMLSIAYKSGAPWNETYWSNTTFDKLLVEARTLADTAKRKELYGEMQRLIHEEGGSVIPVYADFLDAKRSRVKGYETSPVSDLSGDRVSERVWLES
jgi:peptide/nickel transport system substrate-binding protein